MAFRFRFGYESLIINQWQGVGNISCAADDPQKQVPFCENSGEQVIHNLNFDPRNLYFNHLCMLFYVLGVYLIGYVGLTVRVIRAR